MFLKKTITSNSSVQCDIPLSSRVISRRRLIGQYSSNTVKVFVRQTLLRSQSVIVVDPKHLCCQIYCISGAQIAIISVSESCQGRLLIRSDGPLHRRRQLDTILISPFNDVIRAHDASDALNLVHVVRPTKKWLTIEN
jgi:hypothetical protein